MQVTQRITTLHHTDSDNNEAFVWSKIWILGHLRYDGNIHAWIMDITRNTKPMRTQWPAVYSIYYYQKMPYFSSFVSQAMCCCGYFQILVKINIINFKVWNSSKNAMRQWPHRYTRYYHQNADHNQKMDQKWEKKIDFFPLLFSIWIVNRPINWQWNQ